MTDVTGFGLLGHLLGICEASKLGAELRLDAIPYLPGAAALSAQRVRSSLFAENAAQLPEISTGGVQDLLFDPQTAGGLLAALPMRGRKFGFQLEEIRQWLLIYENEGDEAQNRAFVEMADRQMSELRKQREQLDEALQELHDLRATTLSLLSQDA